MDGSRDQLGNWNIREIAKGCVGRDRAAAHFSRVRCVNGIAGRPLRDHLAEPRESRLNLGRKGAPLLAQPRHAVKRDQGSPLAFAGRGRALYRGRPCEQPPFDGRADFRRHGRPAVAQAQKQIPLVARIPKDLIVSFCQDLACSRTIKKLIVA
jgi:hypothetical protein